jgi:hypothetical protein
MQHLSTLSQLIFGDVTISFENGEYTVFGSGEEFGFDDEHWYEMRWDSDTDSVYSVAYSNDMQDEVIGGAEWSEPVTSLQEFADVVNGFDSERGHWS